MRQAKNQATKNYNQANQLETAALGNSTALYDQLDPTYTQEATNPQGYGAPDIAAMDTAAEQSAGGAEGSAVGQGNREAAANRNSGSFAPALDEASRAAGRNFSADALSVQNKNADLKQKQRQEGISGLSGLQGEQNSDILGSIGLENQSTNSLVNAGNSGWFQNMMALMKQFGGSGSLPQSSGSGGSGGSDDEDISNAEAVGA